MFDQYGRDINYLRISLTDRCNLRCQYCMPEKGIQWMKHEDILSYEQIERLVRIFAKLGIHRIRLTGGEPLVRKDVHVLVRALRNIDGIEAVNLTTNGILLEEQLPKLMEAGLTGVNISLDTLDRDQYREITRKDALDEALKGIEAAIKTQGLSVKLNCVPMRENDSQLIPLARLAKDYSIAVRFIELMPIGLGSHLGRRTEKEVKDFLEKEFGKSRDIEFPGGAGPGRYVTFDQFEGKVGFISAMTHAFCEDCNRVRLTADGSIKACLQYEQNVNLKKMMEDGVDDEQLYSVISQIIKNKPARHHFLDGSSIGDEKGNMNQIGG